MGLTLGLGRLSGHQRPRAHSGRQSKYHRHRHSVIVTSLTKIRLLGAKPGQVSLEMDIEKKHTNRLEILHGGTIASLVDLGGSLAVASRGLYSTGVTTDLNVTYLSSGGKVGDRIAIECLCQKLGATLAFTQVNFYDNQSRLFARGSHTKFLTQAYKNVSTTASIVRHTNKPLNELDLHKP
uniref:ARAD1C30426p n=1 Tax=Blastobotrys adeninivorans TaxID=409370 RepID=A0A060T381_BLAAD